MTILVVDDHDVNRRLLRAQLEAENFSVVTAADGVEALRALEQGEVDAIITDVLMPNMDGFRLCREVRAHPRFGALPLIIYTSTYNSPEDRKLAENLGADAYVVKPAPTAVLLDWLTRARRGAENPRREPAAGFSELHVSRQYSEALVRKLEAKNAELAEKVESLERAENQLRLQGTALETTANAVVITARSGTIRWVNPAFTAMTGYSAAEAIGQNPRLLKSGRHEEAFYRELWRAITAGETWRGELVNRRKDGTFYHGEQTISPVRGEDGAISHFVGVMNDITTRKRAEEQARTLHLRVQHLLEHSPVVIYGLRLEGENVVPLVVSEQITQLLGFSPAETLAPEWWPSHVHPDDRRAVDAGVREAIAHESSRTIYRIRHQDGSYRWVEDLRRLVRAADGQPAEIIGVWADITERKRAEEVLQNASRGYAGRKRRRAGWEAVGLAALMLVFGVVHFITDNLEQPLALVALLCLALLAAYRRWHAASEDLAQEQHVQSALVTLHGELERRVQQRTAELSRSNEALRAQMREREAAEAALERERRLMRTLIDHIPDLIYVKDRESRFLLANRALAELMGVPGPAELLGRTDAEFYAPEIAEGYRRDELRVLQGEPLVNQEELNHRAGAAPHTFLTTKLPLRDRDGPTVGVVGIGRDITARKQAEENLRESERRFREMLENLELIAMTLDREGRVTFCNDHLLRLTGWSRAEALGSDWFTRFLPPGPAELKPAFFRGLESGTISAHYENPIVTRTGERREIVWNNTILRDAAGAIIGTASIGEDVTERKRTEAVLRRTRDQYESIFENAIEGIYRTTPAGEFLAINPAMARIFGYESAAEMARERGDRARESYVQPAVREEFQRRIESEGSVRGFEYEARRKDGSIIWVSENARAVREESGAVLCYEGSVEDITERKLSEERARVQQAVTTALAEASSLAQGCQRILAALGTTWSWDLGEVWLVDRAAAAMRCAETWHSAAGEFNAFVEAARQMTLSRGEGLIGRVWASGRPAWSSDIAHDPGCVRRHLAEPCGLRSWTGFPIRLRHELLGVVGFFSLRPQPPDERKLEMLDALGAQIGQFMERQQLAEQFRQAQKMEAIGTLAGGIAHDFNNIIAAIAGYAELARMELGNDIAVESHLKAVRTGAVRATTLVRQILTFSRQQEQERAPVQLRHIVHEALSLLRASIPATIEFETRVDTDLPAVLADATQIHQVVMNLCTNAWHAMRDRSGRLGVILERYTVDASLAALHAGLNVGEYARLSVSDTGHGMDEATVGRIFEPFFTTKAPGEGTGLGLSVVHGIVQSHDGVITVYSRPGEGTIFRLYFPVLQEDVNEAPAESAPLPLGRGQRVLYIDDEAALADMMRRTLEQLGYSVEARTDAVAACDALSAEPDAYDLVITDFAMPGMSGVDVAQKLQAIRPALPVILVTGYAASMTAARVQSLGLRDMLLKPVSIPSLAHAIARALDEKPT